MEDFIHAADNFEQEYQVQIETSVLERCIELHSYGTLGQVYVLF